MFVRVCLMHMRDESDRIWFDLNLGPDGKPVPNMVYFGSWGSLNGVDKAFGVLLSPEGTIDLGSTKDFNSRLHGTNIFDRALNIGEYVTIWWNLNLGLEEHVYEVEMVTQLSAATDLVSPGEVKAVIVDSFKNLPRVRARVKKSFDIVGFDSTVYRPPVGVEGDVAIFQDQLIFCPDNAVAKNGDLITVAVNPDDLEIDYEAKEFDGEDLPASGQVQSATIVTTSVSRG
jgi:hypothetical protein